MKGGVPSPLDLAPLLSSFAIIALAELGDKTQIAVVALSAEHRPRSVFIGALLAFALIDGVSALIGGTIAPYIPPFWIGLAAGITFIIFGTYALLSKEDTVVKIKEHSKAVTTSFLLLAIMELGDKTQLAVIGLAAEYNAPAQVFIGVMLAFTMLTATGAAFGKAISRWISKRYIKTGSGSLFIAFGLIFLIQAITGTKLL